MRRDGNRDNKRKEIKGRSDKVKERRKGTEKKKLG